MFDVIARKGQVRTDFLVSVLICIEFLPMYAVKMYISLSLSLSPVTDFTHFETNTEADRAREQFMYV